MIFVLSSGFQGICGCCGRNNKFSGESEMPNTEKDMREAVCAGGQEKYMLGGENECALEIGSRTGREF